MNPLSRLLAAIFAVLAIAGAFIFGIAVLAIGLGFGLIFYIALRLRMWWLMRQAPPGEVDRQPGADPGDVIETEYTVVSRRRE
jgi:hypothetical protein